MGAMETLKVRRNEAIARQNDPVKNWYIVTEGTVVQRNSYARIMLGKNAVIGISESERYLCDYVAGSDAELSVFPYEGTDDIKEIINGEESMRGILLRAAIGQRQQLLKLYAGLQTLVGQFHGFVGNQYNNYTTYCAQYRLEGEAFNRIDSFKPLEMVHKAEGWEVDNSASLMGGYADEYVRLMQKDDALCIGAIMEACYQTRRVTQGIIEMVEYLGYNQDILLSRGGDDMFTLYYNILSQAMEGRYDVSPVKESMDQMVDVIRKLGIYDKKLVEERVAAYEALKGKEADGPYEVPSGEPAPERAEESMEDCLPRILSYAGADPGEIERVRGLVTEYASLPDILSTDAEAHALRKQLTQAFYDAYEKAFLRAEREEGAGQEPPRPVQMFLNFGFLDERIVGEENATMLYDIASHLDICQSEHVYTIYGWLKSVYDGKNEPSKNEFDMDYPAYLADERKNGRITQEEQKRYANDRERKLRFEIQNMFSSGNRVTYGKISTFCPILGEYDLINSVDKMLVTARRIEEAIGQVRKVDFSAFYREVMFSDPARGINNEPIMKEVLPNVILMPNAGTRAMMWQETGGVRRDSPARFLFPIFTAVDVGDMMVETIGRYRWEICRKIQGVHWNDIREKSLTAEYCDYLQFYRKNSELSAEMKEKIKTALLRGRNNYREVFVRDYVSWVKFESKGSYRLNKVSRSILVSYCPFSKAIREELKANPMYQAALQKLDVSNAKKAQRIQGVYDKYKKAGGEITEELAANLEFYSL